MTFRASNWYASQKLYSSNFYKSPAHGAVNTCIFHKLLLKHCGFMLTRILYNKFCLKRSLLIMCSFQTLHVALHRRFFSLHEPISVSAFWNFKDFSSIFQKSYTAILECELKIGCAPYYLSRKYGARARKRARSILQRQKVWSAGRKSVALHIIRIKNMERGRKNGLAPYCENKKYGVASKIGGHSIFLGQKVWSAG